MVYLFNFKFISQIVMALLIKKWILFFFFCLGVRRKSSQEEVAFA